MRSVVVLVMMVCLKASVMAVPLVQNGDFSVSDGGSGAAGWTGGIRNIGSTGNTGGPGILILNTSFPGAGSSSQTGDTTAGQAYLLQLFYFNLNNIPIVSWNGSVLTPFETFISTTNANYTGLRFSVVGTGLDTITFTGVPLQTGIDDVSLTAVPELGSDLPWGLIAGMLLVTGRRRKRNA